MKIFVLEDDEVRIDAFEEMFKDHVLFISNNVEEAKRILDKNKFDFIFLDHDLDGRIMVNSDEKNTGFQIASYLTQTENKKAKVVLHSYNMKGVVKMQTFLTEDPNFKGLSAVLPFGTFDKNILYNFGKGNYGFKNQASVLFGEEL